MMFDVADLNADRANRLMTAVVTPRPIAWVVTLDADGGRNAAPYSFFNAVCSWPPVLAIGMQARPGGDPKDSCANILRSREFVVNMVPIALVEAMNRTSAPFPPDIDELAEAGLATIASTHVAPPRIADSPAAFECRLRDAISLAADRMLILGDVVALHVRDDAVLDAARGHVDAMCLDLVARMHGAGRYLRSTDLLELARPTGTNV